MSMPCASPWRREGGSVSLEFALALPAFFLIVLAFLHTVGFARDLVVVQVAAREGARAAAVSRDDATVRAAVDAAVDGRAARISISPRQRSTGDLVRVEVILPTRLPVGPPTVTGTAVARVEAIVDAP
ncbi:MAG: pilus assembly protein [Actinobacteria bacterium]|nr:pilus assembly protein [Actinomycetota bacterium]